MKNHPTILLALLVLVALGGAAHAQEGPPRMKQDTPSPGQLRGGGSPLGDARPQRGPPARSTAAPEDRALPRGGPKAEKRAQRKPAPEERRGASGEGTGEAGRKQMKKQREARDEKSEKPDRASDRERTDEAAEKKEAADKKPRGEPSRGERAEKEASEKTEDAAETKQRAEDRAEEDRAETDEAGDREKAKSVQLTGEKRDRVQQAFRGARDVKRRTDVDIDISVGRRLPRSWEFYPVPAVVIDLVPEYRGYVYAYVEDEYVICDPDTYAVVAVIDAPGGGRTAAADDDRCSSSLRLSDNEEELILDSVRETEEVDVRDIRVGWAVPASIELHRFDDRVTARAPELEPCRYFTFEDQVAIVNPRAEKVVLLVEED